MVDYITILEGYLETLKGVLRNSETKYPHVCHDTVKRCVVEFLRSGESEVNDDAKARELMALKVALLVATDFCNKVPDNAPLYVLGGMLNEGEDSKEL